MPSFAPGQVAWEEDWRTVVLGGRRRRRVGGAISQAHRALVFMTDLIRRFNLPHKPTLCYTGATMVKLIQDGHMFVVEENGRQIDKCDLIAAEEIAAHLQDRGIEVHWVYVEDTLAFRPTMVRSSRR